MGEQAFQNGLSDEQMELLDYLLDEEEVGKGEVESIPRRDDPEACPLSFAQERMWFLAELEPQSPAYNVPVAVRLRGSLDAAALERSVTEVVRRHESLRVTFTAAGGQPVARLKAPFALALPCLDLARLPAAERETEARRTLGAEARRPFDLCRGPLLRAQLVRLDDVEHVLLLTFHHIVADAWSMGVFIRETSSCYQAFAADSVPALPGLPIQYADFAAWQRRWLRDEVLESQLAYWKKQLDGAATTLDLPADRPRPPVMSARGATLGFTFPEAVAESTRVLSHHHGTSSFMTLLAVFETLLFRYTGSRDFLLGTPIANRNRSEIEGLIGFFVNTLVMRARPAADLSFQQLLEQVRKEALAAYDHQDLPFEKLVEELQPVRDRSRTPLFQVIFMFLNAPGTVALPGLELSGMELDTGTAKVDLLASVTESDGGTFLGSIEYATDLFDPTTIERLAGHYKRLLEEASHDPTARLSRLPVLSPAERTQLVEEWNATATPYPRDATVHRLFAEQAARTPDAVALVWEDPGGDILDMSYRELDRRSNQLAHHLRRRGVRPESLVGLFVERSPEMMVAVLGVLKAGGAYAPLDPGYPQARLAFLLTDTGVKVVLCQEKLARRLPRDTALLCLDTGWEAVDSEPDESPDVVVTAENLCYVMYTSGTTGTPKGSAVPHRAVVRLVRETDYARLDADEVFLQLAPISFDASTLEIWGPLLNGGRLVLYPPGPLSLDDLATVLARHRITTLWLTAGLFHQMVESRPESLAPLGQLLAGGDVLSPPHVRRAFEHLGGCLVNGYGPTENTTFTCCHLMRDTSAVTTSVPIGRPVANTRIYLVDANLAPVPVGVPGSLLAAGDGLSRGYFRRPALTAAAFIPDPWSAGGRLYDTGDLARYRPDGTVEFLGRADQQVKIRGFRIEPGEIEATLTAHEAVAEAVVVVREEAAGDKRLVAYVVPGAELVPEELRCLLTEKLPPYMVPSVFVLLETLPLDPNGKVDRRALPAPETRPGEASYEAPATPTEEILAGIWAEVLGVEPVGALDDFFEMGGHSLLATRLVSRIRVAFGVEIALDELFKTPRIRELAVTLDTAARGVVVPPLEKASRELPLPLSFAQQRLWFLAQLEPDNPGYHMPAAIAVDGRLDVDVLKRCLDEIVRRHETLRTRFAEHGDETVQIVDPPRPQPLPVIDLTVLPAAVREVELGRRATWEAVRLFDLAGGPLLRTTLVRLACDRHVFLLNQHHIVSDGWSIAVLVREIGVLYRAFACGEAPASLLPELPVQYADFAVWQRRWLEGEVLERQVAYWREKLAGVASLELPIDRPRAAVRSPRGAQWSVALPKSLFEALEALSRERGVTLFMTLLAAFQVLLHRYSGQSDVAVGSPIAGRRVREVEDLIGFFVNTLVFRSDFSTSPAFVTLLDAVREGALAAYAHQDLPFEHLVEALHPERDRSRTPLFQVMLVLQNAPLEDLEIEGLTFKPLRTDSGTAKFDLTLSLVESPPGGTEGLVGSLEYATDLFDATTVARLAGHLKTLLAALVARPEARIATLELLTPAERWQLRAEWNAMECDYPGQDECLHRFFEAQVSRSPEAVALVSDESRLTYRELDERANRLGRYLRSLGVAPEVVVALCAERSPEMVVAVLGILKAGGAYLPLDPSSPAERLAFMIRDSGAQVLVTYAEAAARLPEEARDLRVVSLESEGPAVDRQEAASLNRGAEADGLAYVIYTSGSTGRPKGVMISHRAITNHMLWMWRRFHLTAADTVYFKTPFSFDASVWELFLPLCCGARLAVARPGGHQDSTYLAESAVRHGVTVLQLVPSMFRVFVEEATLEKIPLRLLFAGGEALPTKLAKRFHRRRPDVGLYNLYGPTEATIDATFGDSRNACPGGTVEIGWPVANVRVQLLDAALQPVPVGVAGELHVGGLALARGYLERPGLTAERFVPDPFAGPGERLYKTGDLARRRGDGRIEFLGRIDHQVKIRGFRIELGEVEVPLAAHPAVREAVVLAREDVPGEKRLVAYVVLAAGASADASELHGHLAEKLPGHMVPSAFVVLEEMPLLPNGKVNRQALPAPEARLDEESYVAPRTATEEALAAIFEELLRLPRVGVTDDFFALGGHSLLATRVVSRLRRDFSVELTLSDFFDAPRIAELTARIEATEPATDLPPLVAVPRGGRLPLSFAQQRLWFLHQLEPWNPEYHMPAAVAACGRLDVAVLRGALDEIVRRHEVLRTRFAEVGDEPVQIVEPPRPQNLPVIDLGALPHERRAVEKRRLVAEDAVRLFDLARGPLLRTAVLRCAEDEHVLLLNQHHIVSDGWSIGVLVREIGELYRAFASGETSPSPLPELPVQYVDFAIWQRRWLQGGLLERQVDYWRKKLAGITSFELPTDRPRVPVRSSRGAQRSVALPRPLSEALETLSRERGATLFMTLLAAFQVLLHRYSGQSDVAVGSPIAGRRVREVEDLIGCFVNTLVFRSNLSESPAFVTLLDEVRASALAAYAHQDLPFEHLVEALHPERDRSRTPLFQVMLVLQNAPRGDLEIEGLTFKPLRADSGTAKFDLTLSLLERPPGGTEGGFVGSVEYASDLFDATTIARLAGHFETLLVALVARPETPIATLELLTPAERWQLRAEWNATPLSPAVHRRAVGLHQPFEAQADRTPDSVVLVFENGGRDVLRLSYAELEERANQLARHLLDLGVGPEVLVGVAMERTPEMVAAILAVLKAGGAYVPLDPGYPGERLAFMLEDAQAAVLLTQEHLTGRFADPGGTHVLAVDTFWDDRCARPAARPAATATPDNLAYVIYTSGSTGRAKGVAITHRSALALLDWSQAAFPAERLQGVLASTSVCFDLSVFELFAPLSVGGKVILAQSALALPELSARDEVTLINTVPSAMTELVRMEGVASSVVTVNLAGEPLPNRLVQQVYEQPTIGEVLNLYGPSEDTTYSTWCRVEKGLRGKPSIGRPLPGTQAYVADRRLEGVPVGVPGELYLGGAGLVRGYLARPALTAERFVPDPWSAARTPPTAGARLYRTGDLVRYLADGCLDFLGRMDYQVKIRGFRIELGEIEVALASHEAVDEAVVVARSTQAPGDEVGDPRLVAYAVPADSAREAPAGADLRSFLAERLPGYMIPSAFVILEELPLTPNGKVDRAALGRRALPAPGEPDSAASEAAPPRTELEKTLAEIWCRLLGREKVGIHQSFFDLGGHSLLAAQVTSQLGKALGHKLSVVEMFEHPTIASLARALDPRSAAAVEPRRPRPDAANDGDEIAIVGMAGRFPGARNLQELWRNLAAGREAITFFTPEELAAAGVAPETLADPSYVPARAVLDDVELFDAAFFGFSPREAQLMDPQQRLFLEVAWEALEDAGCDPGRFPGKIAVYAGASLSTYFLQNLLFHPILAETGELEVQIANDKDYLAALLSYRFDLKGPAMSVGTACSTSLVAVHQACRSLLDRECDAALAGGCSVKLPQRAGYLYRQGGIFSSDGHCRSFDAEASGTLGGSGVGTVVLKRLADALAAGDPIHAVVKGTAVNNDGSGKIGFTAPSVDGQAAVIAEAQQRAGVSPETVTYVEAHGTATPLGDPVEVRALTRAFRAGTDGTGFCALGSIKSNLGHLDAAAGVAGLIKTVLALKHRQIPPSLHFETPNPEIDFATSPFFVNAALREWATERLPRRAGVSSFGIGGTNAHAVLEEAPAAAPSGPSRPWQLLVLSARTPTALEEATGRLLHHLRDHPGEELADVTYTLLVGRRRFAARRVLVARDREDALRILEERDPKRLFESFREADERPIAFLFPGQGSQHVGMAAELYEAEPTFRAEVDRCCELLAPHLGRDLRAVIYPPEPTAEAAAELATTALTQPALFVVEHALARLWMEWGLRPAAMLGHSVGELVAACLAGVFSREDALALVAERGRLMQAMPAGAMLAVSRPEKEVRALLPEDLEMAAVNAPARCVVSGPTASVEALSRELAAQDVPHRRLHTSHAFHSVMMEGALAPFREKLDEVRLQAPRIPFLSNVTGTWITAEEATDPGYWVRHLRATVRFSEGLGELLAEPQRLLLEVGPGSTLTTLAREQSGKNAGPRHDGAPVASLPHPGDRRPEQAFLLTAAGRLWLAGAQMDAGGFHAHERRCRVSLPSYPFEGRRYWIEPGEGPPERRAGKLRKNPDVGQWLYLPLWKRSIPLPAAPAVAAAPRSFLVLADDLGLGACLGKRLRQAGHDVVTVRTGEGFARLGDDAYAVAPRCREDYRALLGELAAAGRSPATVVHLWTLTAAAGEVSVESFEKMQGLGFDSLLSLMQVLGQERGRSQVAIEVVSNHLYEVVGGEGVAPEKATVLGPLKVAPQELPNLSCRLTDVTIPASGLPQEELVEQLLAELEHPPKETEVAYRGSFRWLRSFEAWPSASAEPARLRPRGVYLVTGGLGGIGLVLAEYLARTVEARLVLLSRSGLPPREQWPSRLESHGDEDPTSRRIRQVRHLEELGAEVLALAADVADPEQMGQAVARARERFGAIHGVIHAAGVAGGGLILLKTPQEVSRVLRPKTLGLLTLDALLPHAELDFFVLLSSIASVAGGVGQVDYCAANLFLDAYAEHRDAKRTLMVAVNWDAWQEVGMAVETEVPESLRALRDENLRRGLTNREGQEVFSRILASCTAPRVIVSTSDLEAQLELGKQPPAQLLQVDPAPAEVRYERPDLESRYAAPRNEIEKELAEIWQTLLKISSIGIHDNFFDLGGHSLMALQIVSRIEEAFGVELSVRSLFEAATLTELAELVAAARPATAEGEPPTAVRLVPVPEERLWLPDGMPAAVRLPEARIAPVSRDAELPLSFSQERLWILEQLEPGRTAYVIFGGLVLTGRLDAAALAASFSEIVRRHEALRTRFPSAGGRTRQVIAAPAPVPLPRIDLRALPGPQRRAETRRLAAGEVSRPFNLADGPLMRTTLLQTSPREHVLVLAMHHIVSDGWSVGILVWELSVLYNAFSTGATSPLPELPVQYADFAAWQRRCLTEEVLEEQLGYWKQQLAGVPFVLDLPTDRPRPAVQSYRGATVRFTFSHELTVTLRTLNRQLGVTLFMTLLAGFEAQLGRNSNQRKLLVGTPVANRGRVELEGLIGVFVNTLVMPGDLAGDPSFGELLTRVRESALDAYAHQDLPFERLVKELNPQRDLSRTPLFQVMFVFQNAPTEVLELPGLTLKPLDTDWGTARFDLLLTLTDTAEGLVGSIEYPTDLFDASTVVRLPGHLETLLRAAAADVQRPISELPLLTPAEYQQLFVEWNEPQLDDCLELPLHELFEAQVERTPDAEAVIAGVERFTYRELNRRANQLAHHLRRLGAAPEALAGISMHRSPDMVVAILGVMKAGGAYVPLDPAYPRERVAFMLEDARVSLLLTQEDLVPALPEHRASLVRVDADAPAIAAQSEENPGRRGGAGHVAYVIYTSGSTGRAKGVVIEHRSAVALVRWARETFPAEQLAGVLASTSICFDLSVFELFVPLSCGGKVVLAENALALPDLKAANEVTMINTVPSAMTEILRLGGVPAGAVTVNLAGEALQRQLVEKIYQLGTVERVWNLYGPSEDTTYSTGAVIERGRGTPPIGRPVANSQAYVLDRRLQPVPVGVPGEVYVGGPGLARGYLARPALTAERFVPHPFAEPPVAGTARSRLYRTGDLARYLPDGNLDYLGRLDFQVKIRGFRIELGEVESTLLAHPELREVAVMAWPTEAPRSPQGDGPEVEKRLVAFVVAGEGRTVPPVGELRAYVRSQLPEAMAPSLFVELPALPLLPNGKVDRAALGRKELGRRKLEARRPGTEGGPVAPRDALEIELVRIWEELLDVAPIGVRDNFFELGGHSLSAVRLLALIDERLGWELPLSALFQDATVEGLAGRLRQQTADPAAGVSCLVPMQLSPPASPGRRPPLVCVHPAGGNVLAFLPLARALGPEQPFYALQSRGLEDDAEPFARVEDMAAHYIEEVRSVDPEGPYHLAGWSFGGLVAFEMARQLQAAGREVALLALLDTAAPAAEAPTVPLGGSRGGDTVDNGAEDDAFYLSDIVSFLARLAQREPPVTYEELRSLAPAEQVRRFLASLREIDFLPPGAGEPQVRRLLRVFKANLRAGDRYRGGRYAGRVTLLRAAEVRVEDPALGWEALVTEPLEIHEMPGDHVTLLSRATVGELAARLRRCFEKLRAVPELSP